MYLALHLLPLLDHTLDHTLDHILVHMDRLEGDGLQSGSFLDTSHPIYPVVRHIKFNKGKKSDAFYSGPLFPNIRFNARNKLIFKS